MSWIEIIADRKIRDAQEEGAFDDLPGKGKPLKLEFDPRIPPELRAAYRLMKEAQLLPDWIQLDKEVRQREENPNATAFWRRAIDEYTRGDYEETRWVRPQWSEIVQTFSTASAEGDLQPAGPPLDAQGA